MEQQKTILLVEDDQILIKMYTRKFEKEGLKVLAALDGQQGLQIIQNTREKPNVVLLDVMLPKMNGFDLLEKIKANPITKDIPVILLTNLAGNQEDREKGKRLGAADYLVKSDLTPTQIVEKVKSYLG